MAKTNAIFRPHGDENGLLFRPQRGCVSAPRRVDFPLQAGDESTEKTM
jgi:hypothetical protein